MIPGGLSNPAAELHARLQLSSSDQNMASSACSREVMVAMVGRWEGCLFRHACMRSASTAGQVAGEGMSSGSCSFR